MHWLHAHDHFIHLNISHLVFKVKWMNDISHTRHSEVAKGRGCEEFREGKIQ